MLVVDAVQKAKSCHPGTPMDAAPAAYTLWQRVLCYDPVDPGWINRDRFVLSAGHACMLLYSLIHLSGVKAANPTYEQIGRDAVTLDDIKAFRQAGSRCPGHPEYGWTSGVETTTGPLGQGAATSVGMAIARQWLSATYNRPGFDLFDFNVYALCGDGDMMEGIASEAASLAGHLRLANLCWIYDSNRVTIEGHTDIAFTEDVAAHFMAYDWDVRRVTDANDMVMFEHAYRAFHQTQDRPTLIVVHSHIGYGAPHKQDSPEAHGEPLGEAEVRLTKQFFGFNPDQDFVVPDGVRAQFAAQIGARGAEQRKAAGDVRALYCAVSGPCRADRLHWRARTAVRMGGCIAGLSAQRLRAFDARCVRQGTERRGRANPVARWRRSGPDAEHQDADDLRLRRRFPTDRRAGELSWPQPALRCARTCDVRRGQRHDADRPARVRLGLPDLHRLCARCDPAGLADGSAGAAYMDT
jgi:transketolase N-terminal domain/subunit